MENYRIGVEQAKEYFKDEFAKPDFKTLKSRIPLFLEFKKVYFANRFFSESFAEFEISGIVINALRDYYRRSLIRHSSGTVNSLGHSIKN